MLGFFLRSLGVFVFAWRSSNIVLANAIATVRITHEIRSYVTDVSAVEGISRVDSIQCIITEVCVDLFTWKLYLNE